MLQKHRFVFAGICAIAFTAIVWLADIGGRRHTAEDDVAGACPPATPLGDEPGCEPEFDSMGPRVVPAEPGGAEGFTRYLFQRGADGKIATVLTEGPRGEQVRCQQEELLCSYLDLKALHQTGVAIPEELHMTRDELGELVSQLDTLSEHLASYDSIDQACADGYQRDGKQAHNMGIHMTNMTYAEDGIFDLRKPEILLFAREGGEDLPEGELGHCEHGRWTGDRRLEIVGAAFLLPTEDFGDDHPTGFAGPLDNWHVHHNICVGSDATVAPPVRAPIMARTKEQCEARGARFFEKAGWMIHAYALPKFDAQGGVFAMFNPAIWPTGEPVERSPVSVDDETDRLSVISNFQFERIETAAGEAVKILNSDNVPHTVTAGTPDAPAGTFDSGSISPGESFIMRLEEPGQFEFFCTHHPLMTGQVVVK